MKLEIPQYSIDCITTDTGKYLKAEDVSDFMLATAQLNPGNHGVFLILARIFSGKQNLTSNLTSAKVETAENVVPEAGIEPATKGL